MSKIAKSELLEQLIKTNSDLTPLDLAFIVKMPLSYVKSELEYLQKEGRIYKWYNICNRNTHITKNG